MDYCDGKEMSSDCMNCRCDLIDITFLEDALKEQRKYVTGLYGGYCKRDGKIKGVQKESEGD